MYTKYTTKLSNYLPIYVIYDVRLSSAVIFHFNLIFWFKYKGRLRKVEKIIRPLDLSGQLLTSTYYETPTTPS